MEEIIKYLEERIIYLKEIEWEYFNKQYKVNEPIRTIYRNTSNEFCARRQELEQMARDLNIKLNIS